MPNGWLLAAFVLLITIASGVSLMSLIQRYKRRKDREARHASLMQWCIENDPDFAFEVACMGLRATMKKYSVEGLQERWNRGNLVSAGSVGSQGFTVPQGVSAVQVSMIGAGDGGSAGVASQYGGGGAWWKR